RVHRRSIGRKRQQIGYYMLGIAFYAVGGVLFAGVFQIVGHIHFDPGLVGYFSLGWVALTFYAITRHRLFDIRFVASRATVGMVLTVLLVSVDVLLYRWLTPPIGATVAVTVTSVALGVALVMTPLVPFLETRTRFLFVRHRYDYQRALKESTLALA